MPFYGFQSSIWILWIPDLSSNLTCSLEDQECEESTETAEQQPENEGLDSDEEVQQLVYRICGGRRPRERCTSWGPCLY